MTTVALRHARVRYGPLEALHGIGLTAPGPGLTVLRTTCRNDVGDSSTTSASTRALP